MGQEIMVGFTQGRGGGGVGRGGTLDSWREGRKTWVRREGGREQLRRESCPIPAGDIALLPSRFCSYHILNIPCPLPALPSSWPIFTVTFSINPLLTMPALSGWTFLNMEHAVKLRAYVGCFLVKPGLQNNTTSPNSGVIPHPAKCTGLSLEAPQPNPSPTNNETNKTAKPKLMSLPFGAMDDIRVLSRI